MSADAILIVGSVLAAIVVEAAFVALYVGIVWLGGKMTAKKS